jgi:hypothetical protein
MAPGEWALVLLNAVETSESSRLERSQGSAGWEKGQLSRGKMVPGAWLRTEDSKLAWEAVGWGIRPETARAMVEVPKSLVPRN